MLSWTKYLATLMSELDDFFDEAELDSTALVEVRRVRLESLMQCTVLWDDEATGSDASGDQERQATATTQCGADTHSRQRTISNTSA